MKTSSLLNSNPKYMREKLNNGMEPCPEWLTGIKLNIDPISSLGLVFTENHIPLFDALEIFEPWG